MYGIYTYIHISLHTYTHTHAKRERNRERFCACLYIVYEHGSFKDPSDRWTVDQRIS